MTDLKGRATQREKKYECVSGGRGRESAISQFTPQMATEPELGQTETGSQKVPLVSEVGGGGSATPITFY